MYVDMKIGISSFRGREHTLCLSSKIFALFYCYGFLINLAAVLYTLKEHFYGILSLVDGLEVHL